LFSLFPHAGITQSKFANWDEDVEDTLALTFGGAFGFEKTSGASSSGSKPSGAAALCAKPKRGSKRGAPTNASGGDSASDGGPPACAATTITFLDRAEQELLLLKQLRTSLRESDTLLATTQLYVGKRVARVAELLLEKNVAKFTSGWTSGTEKSRGMNLYCSLQEAQKLVQHVDIVVKGIKLEPMVEARSMKKALTDLASYDVTVHVLAYERLAQIVCMACVAEFDWERLNLTLDESVSSTNTSDGVSLHLYQKQLLLQLASVPDEAERDALLAKGLSESRVSIIIAVYETLLAVATTFGSPEGKRLLKRTHDLTSMLFSASYAGSLDPVRPELAAALECSLLALNTDHVISESVLTQVNATTASTNTKSKFWKVFNGTNAGRQLAQIGRDEQALVEGDNVHIADVALVTELIDKHFSSIESGNFTKGRPLVKVVR
jgi:hypothetical protein